MQLQQRIITSGPIKSPTPPPLSAIGMPSGIPGIPTNRAHLDPQYARSSVGKITPSNATSPDLPESVFQAPGKPRSPLPPNRPLTPPYSPSPLEVHPAYREIARASPYGNGNPYGSSNSNGNGNPYGSSSSNGNGNPYGSSSSNSNGNPYGSSSSNGNGNPYGGVNSNNNGNPYGNPSPYGNGNSSSQQRNQDNSSGSSLSLNRPPLNGRQSSQNQYKPMATTVSTGGLFGFGKRTRVEPVVEPPENPLVDEYLAAANIADEYGGMDRQTSVSTNNKTVSLVGSSILEHDPPNINPYPDVYSPRQQVSKQVSQQFAQQFPSIAQRPSPNPSDMSRRSNDTRSSQDTRSSGDTRGSQDTLTRYPTGRSLNMEVLQSPRSLNTISLKDLLPSEMNKFGGFCKGAWRQQIGDKKKAMEERTRPGGVYNAAKYWQCKSCKFEGRLVVIDKKSSRFDMRVFKLVDGIQFRWEFMFKSHIAQKDALPDPTKSTFGCIFCCAEGRGTPTFNGVQAFMQHLTQHRDPLPTGEILYRMNCLVGRQATVNEDFDVNIISAEGGFL